MHTDMHTNMRTWSQRRKTIRSRMLHEACIRILLRDGVTGITMDAVSQEAKVAKGTLYNYFRNKEDLLERVEAGLFDPITQLIKETAASDLPGRSRLCKMACQVAAGLDKDRTSAPLILTELSPYRLPVKNRLSAGRYRLHDAMITACRDAFESSQANSVDPAMAALLFFGALLGLLEHRLSTESQRPVDKDVAQLMTAFFPTAYAHETTTTNRAGTLGDGQGLNRPVRPTPSSPETSKQGFVS